MESLLCCLYQRSIAFTLIHNRSQLPQKIIVWYGAVLLNYFGIFVLTFLKFLFFFSFHITAHTCSKTTHKQLHLIPNIKLCVKIRELSVSKFQPLCKLQWSKCLHTLSDSEMLKSSSSNFLKVFSCKLSQQILTVPNHFLLWSHNTLNYSKKQTNKQKNLNIHNTIQNKICSITIAKKKILSCYVQEENSSVDHYAACQSFFFGLIFSQTSHIMLSLAVKQQLC